MDKKDGGPIDLEALREVRDYFADRQDAEQLAGESFPTPNEEMRLLATVDSVIAELTARRARDAEVEALVAADLELNRAIEAAGGFVEEGYAADSYGVYGSDFERCLACDAESGAGVLNKGVTHEADCVRHRYEVALARRAEALAPFTGAKP